MLHDKHGLTSENNTVQQGINTQNLIIIVINFSHPFLTQYMKITIIVHYFGKYIQKVQVQ